MFLSVVDVRHGIIRASAIQRGSLPGFLSTPGRAK